MAIVKFSLRIALTAFLILFFASALICQNHDFKIVIDPGHGGKDPGNRGTGRYKYSEKQIALKVSLMFGQLIQKKFSEVKIIYTRKTDKFVSLRDRSKLANRKKADLFVSIHCNYVSKPTPYGTETFVMGLHKTRSNFEIAKKENSVIFFEKDYKIKYEGFNPNSPESFIGFNLFQKETLGQSLRFAKYVEDEFSTTAHRKSRGVKQAGFWVISKNIMPSILIELGFLTNRKEEDFLQSKKGKKIMSKAIFSAFCKYYKEWKNKNGIVSNINREENKRVEKKNNFYSVLLLSSRRRTKTNKGKFRKLSGVYEIRQDSRYLYLFGKKITDIDAAYKLLKNVKQAGFKSPVLVRIVDNRIVEKFPSNFIPKQGYKKSLSGIRYRVQIYASSHKVDLDSPIFKGLNSLEFYESDHLYKYTVGNAKTYDEIVKLWKSLREKGFKDAFIIAIKDGKRVPLPNYNEK